jgi:hypothetical protein
VSEPAIDLGWFSATLYMNPDTGALESLHEVLDEAPASHISRMTPRQRCASQLVGALILIARGEQPNLMDLSASMDPLPDMARARESRIVKHNKHLYMRANGTLFRQTVDRALDHEWDEVEVPKPEEPEKGQVT